MTIVGYNFPEGRQLGNNYRVLSFLGKGWEGEVYKVEERLTGIVRAAKFFYSRRENKKGLLKYALKLNRLRTCPIITQYHHKDYTIHKKNRVEFLISDFVDGMMLSQYISKQRKKRIPYFEALHILYAVCQGVEHIHFLKEYHGDIHSDNIIIKRAGLGYDVKLIDLMDHGKSTSTRIFEDVCDLICLLYEMIGEADGYSKAPKIFKGIILGRNSEKIKAKFKDASQLRVYLENMEW